MPNSSNQTVVGDLCSGKRAVTEILNGKLWMAAVFAAMAITLAGCRTPTYPDLSAQIAGDSDPLVLHEGDAIRVTFPGAPNLDVAAQIRRDGKITLKLVGEFKAAGMTPADMEKELIKLYGPQLQSKEVVVSVDSAAFPVYVTGAVLRPGKIMSDRPMTALEAIMESGGFDTTKANMKAVGVIRHNNGQTEHFTLNLRQVLQGKTTETFDLKPHDIIYVPERFNWF